MPKIFKFINSHRISMVFAILILLASGISAQATGLLNTPTSGYLVCVNSKTKVVTHPGTAVCPKGSKKLILGTQGIQGLTGAAGLNGANGIDGRDGKDGKTLWNGVKDPENTWGAPGDMFINSVTKTLFGPKNLDGTWPAGVSIVGPKGDQGAIGLTGPMGPQGPGGTGPQGPAGPTGAAGSNATLTCAQGGTCVIGDTGPGGGKVFYISPTPNTPATPWRYLEAAPQTWRGTSSDPWAYWCSNSTNFVPSLLGGSTSSLQTSAAIGQGFSNTQEMLKGCNYGAANIAVAYNGGGKSDWYLPSKGEMFEMYLSNGTTGLLTMNAYWTSSESSATDAWLQSFEGVQLDLAKTVGTQVRPIRAF